METESTLNMVSSINHTREQELTPFDQTRLNQYRRILVLRREALDTIRLLRRQLHKSHPSTRQVVESMMFYNEQADNLKNMAWSTRKLYFNGSLVLRSEERVIRFEEVHEPAFERYQLRRGK